MKIGSTTVDAVVDGEFRIARDIPYPGIAAERWRKYEHLLKDGREIVNQLGGYLIRGEDYVALIDVGFGPAKVESWEAGGFMDSLHRLGVKPDEVTDVIFTHLHFDHIGWASIEGDPVFPNATYRCHERDWHHFTGPDHVDAPELLGPGATTFPTEMTAQVKLAPIADRIELWAGEGTIRPGLEVVELPGHTPGTSAIRQTSQGESALFVGDVAHHQAELVEPDFHFIADMDPELASSSQQKLLAELVRTGTPFAAAHFRDFAWGRVTETDDGLTWVPVGGAGE